VGGLDEAAFSAFYTANARGLWAYVYRVTGNPADADDVVQEAFLRTLRSGPESGDAVEQRRYLYRVASNLMVDRWRQHKRDDAIERAQADVARVAEAGAAPADDEVAKTFAKLNARERALLWLAYVEGESHDEIATALGVGARSVRVLLFRAKRRLRDLLVAGGLART
jgi:RNA polymerase sigma-70 factor (ECF subfamily)